MKGSVVAFAICTAVAAQDRAPLRDALEWTAAQRGRMAEMNNRVVRIYGTAALAGLLCADDPVTASGLYRDAITGLHVLPDSIFKDKGTTVLPAASFTGLWKFVVPAAVKCDPGIVALADNQRSKERIESERRGANATLKRGLELIDPDSPLDKHDQLDRAAQLGHAALDAADPDTFDFDNFALLLLRLRDAAPDLATDLLQRALDLVVSSSPPRAERLQELARYVLTSPKHAGQEDNTEHDTFTAGNVSIENLMRTRLSANPDDISMLIEATVKLLNSNLAFNHNPTGTWAMGWQLLPQARALEPARVTELENALAAAQSAFAIPTGQIQSVLGTGENPDPDSGDPAARNYWLVGQVQGALAGDRVDQARALLASITDLPARGQLTVIVGFREAVVAIAQRPEQALSLVNLLPGGIKRAVLYISMIATAKDSDTPIQISALATRDIVPLPAEQRVRLLSTLAATLLRSNVDTAMTVLRDLVRAANDVYVNPRRGRFDPASVRRTFNPNATTSSDTALILPNANGFFEAVQTVRGRHNFTLRAPGLVAFKIVDFLSAANGVDPGRLEAAILELKDENTRMAALVRLGDVRIKGAKASTSSK